jgi:hypothetical protein
VEGIAFSAFGNRIGVRVNREPLPGEVRALSLCGWKKLPPASTVDHLYSLLLQEDTEHSKIRRFHLAYSGAALISRSLDRREVITQLISDLHRHAAEFSRRELFVHAGVVGWKGHAILVPGRSYSGKSTLVAELVRAGAAYYSDEYAVLDRAGRVHPYPRPMVLRGSNRENAAQTSVSYSTSHSPKPLPVSAVLFTHFRDGARWRPRKLSPSQTLVGLLSHTVQARTRPRAALSILQRATQNCLALAGPRGEARPTAETLLEQFRALGGEDEGVLATRGEEGQIARLRTYSGYNAKFS